MDAVHPQPKSLPFIFPMPHALQQKVPPRTALMPVIQPSLPALTASSASSPSSRAAAPTQAATFLPPPPAHPWLLGLCLLLIAFNLRPVFGSLSVVLPEIMRDTGLGATGASLLTTLPIVCLGVFSAPAPALARRFGVERTLLGALLLICIGTFLRAWPSLPLLFASAVLAGAGIAIGNVLVLGMIKRDFPRRAAMMTGLYTLAICLGAAISTAFTVPLEQHFFGGAWAPALAFWGLPAAVVLLIWAPLALSARHERQMGHFKQPRSKAGSLARDPLAWQVTVFMGSQSAMAYIVMGWLAPILRERGLESADAGYVVATAIVTQLVTSLITPSIAARCRDQRAFAVGVSLLVVVSVLALILGPLGARWLWAVLLGCGMGSCFALALSLIVMRSSNANVTAQLSAMAQGWGYALAAFGPLLVGLLRGWTGGYNSAAVLVALVGVVMVWSGWGAGRNRLVTAHDI